MKEYIKPTFITAGLFPVALALNCATTPEDMELIGAILNGADSSDAKVFAINECEDEYDFSGMFCKYASVEDGAAKVLNS